MQKIVTMKLGGKIPEGYTILAANWKLASDMNFQDIIRQSLNDEVNLLSIKMKVNTEIGIKYYGQLQLLLKYVNSAGEEFITWSKPSNIDIFEVTDINDITLNIDMPGIVALPRITTTSIVDNHDLANFTIQLTEFASTSNAKHTSTDILIENIDGDIVWKKHVEKGNLTSILTDNLLLEQNKVYRIKAMFNASSNDSSQISTLTIKTTETSDVAMLTDILALATNKDNFIDFYYRPYLKEIQYELLYDDGVGFELVSTGTNVTDNVTKINIPMTVLTTSALYIIKVRYKYIDADGNTTYSNYRYYRTSTFKFE